MQFLEDGGCNTIFTSLHICKRCNFNSQLKLKNLTHLPRNDYLIEISKQKPICRDMMMNENQNK